MPETQITGDKKDLGMRPIPQPPSGRVSGGAVEITGDSINLSRTPVSNAPPLKTDGRVQATGETLTLGTTPVKGLGSAASIPMSERAIAQSKSGR